VQLLTVSRVKTWRRCARLHELEYNRGYRPVAREDVLVLGSAVHVGLEAWWEALADPTADPLEAALAAVAGQLEDAYEQARAEVLLEGYHHRWLGAGLEPLLVEAEYRAPLVNPQGQGVSRTFELAGKIDVIAREPSGRLVLLEHKTAGVDITIGSDYWKRLRMDDQVSSYFEGAAALGYQVEACLYDVLGKPALRPAQIPLVDEQGAKIVLDASSGTRIRTKDGKKWRETGDSAAGYMLQTRPESPEEFRARLREAVAAEPDRYFARGEIVRLEQDLAAHRLDTWETANAIRYSQRLQLAPRNADACTAYGRTCAFFSSCCNEESHEGNPKFQKLDFPHTELTEVSSIAADRAAEGDAA
jgi:hypothetical protein